MAPIHPLHLLDRALSPTMTTLLSSTLTRRQQDPGTTVVVVPNPNPTPTIIVSDPSPTTVVVTDNDPTDAQTLTTGAIVGIVIGSIVGFLLLVWIIRSCTNLGAPPGSADENPGGRAWYDGIGRRRRPREVVVSREEVREYGRRGSRSRSRSARRDGHYGHGHGGGHRHHHHHHHHGGRRSGSQVREVVPVAVVRGNSPYRTGSRSRSRHERY